MDNTLPHEIIKKINEHIPRDADLARCEPPEIFRDMVLEFGCLCTHYEKYYDEDEPYFPRWFLRFTNQGSRRINHWRRSCLWKNKIFKT